MQELDPTHPNAFDATGLEIDVQCEHEEYEGKDRERWQLPRGGMELNQLDKKGLAGLQAMFGNKLKAAFGGKSQAAAPAKKTAVPAPAQQEQVTEEVY